MGAKISGQAPAHGQIQYTEDRILEVRVEEEYGVHAYLEILDHECRAVDKQAAEVKLPQIAYQRAQLRRPAALTKATSAKIPEVCNIEWFLRYRRQYKFSRAVVTQLRRLHGRHYPDWLEKLCPVNLPIYGLRYPLIYSHSDILGRFAAPAVLLENSSLQASAHTDDALYKMRVSSLSGKGDAECKTEGAISENLENADENSMPVSVSEWPRISVITVSYNQAKYLCECLQSVIGQNYPYLEYIVIDGGSTDGSAEILQRYREHFSTLIIEPDHGQSAALNKGFAFASGDVLTWLCSDDCLEPGALAVVAEARVATSCDLIVGGCRVIDEKGQTKYVHHSAFVTEGMSSLSFGDMASFTATWQKGLYFYQPEVFFSRDLWRRAGSHVKEHLHYAMDYELFLRFALAGGELFATREILGCSRQHSEQKTRHEVPIYLPTISRILRDFHHDLADLRPDFAA